MTDDFGSWLLGDLTKVKEASLDDKLAVVRQAVREKLCPASPVDIFSKPLASSEDVWVMDIYPDYAIIQKGNGPFHYFKVPYTIQDGKVVVSDAMIPVEKVWVEKPAESAGIAA